MGLVICGHFLPFNGHYLSFLVIGGDGWMVEFIELQEEIVDFAKKDYIMLIYCFL